MVVKVVVAVVARSHAIDPTRAGRRDDVDADAMQDVWQSKVNRGSRVA